MTIAPMTAETLPLVAGLERQCFSTPWSLSSLEQELTNPWAIWLTAMESGTLLGYLGVQYGPDGADIMSIATDLEARGRGAAKALLSEMYSLLRQKRLKWLTLEVRLSNAAALSLYRSQGFTEVGRRPRYYQNPREDALLLTKYL